jgi:glycosyltransferase involved in cell wall biosynthesis
MSIKVSIITLSYNGEKYIRETIDSCLNQTYPNVEIIVIDDCSSDNTINILKEYGEKIRLYQNEENQGISKNLNRAVNLSQGEYFTLLGHDDLFAKNHVEIMLKEFTGKEAFVHCNSFLIDKEGKVFGIGVNDFKQRLKTQFIKIFLSFGTVIHSPGVMIKKEYFNKVKGWDERYKNYGEWLVWIKMASVAKVKYCTKVKAYYRRHDTNITNSFQNENVKSDLLDYRDYCIKTAVSNLNIYEQAIFYLLKLLKKVKK